MLRLTVWMNMPSFHQDGLFNALAGSGAVDLRVIFAKDTTPDRVELGWEQGSRHYDHRTLSKGARLIDAIRIARAEGERLHIVNGIWAEPAFAAALCALARSRFAIYAEAPEPGQAHQQFKELAKRTFGRWVARRALGILSISRLAHRYYAELGFSRDQIYPFGYFRADFDGDNLSSRPANNERTEIIFAGQLIDRKGVDILIEAMNPLFVEHPDLYLTVIGAGERASALKKQAASLSIEDRIIFEGAISSGRMQQRLSAADLLVLPSRWDGWGMVVNEALSVAVPALVSDHCGASDLIRHGINGYVFRSEDAKDLRDCLVSFLNRRGEWMAMRSAARNTGRAVSAEAAAPYLIECLEHMTGASTARPVPPWAQLDVVRSADR